MPDLQIRLFDPDRDDLSELTLLIRRAYASLAELGLRYVGTWQDEDVTARRMQGGECRLATLDGVLVGTVVLKPPGRQHGHPWYARPDVAYFGQLCVEPGLQGQGIGGRLLDAVEQRAGELGAHHVACDTSEQAHHLIAWYLRRGYAQVATIDWESTNYLSVLLSRGLRA